MIMLWRFLRWLPVVIGGVFAAVQIQFASEYATSSPQQGAGAALALAYVVIPYCVARALSEMMTAEDFQRIVGDRSLRQLSKAEFDLLRDDPVEAGSLANPPLS